MTAPDAVNLKPDIMSTQEDLGTQQTRRAGQTPQLVHCTGDCGAWEERRDEGLHT